MLALQFVVERIEQLKTNFRVALANAGELAARRPRRSAIVYTLTGLFVDTAMRGRRASRTSASDTRPCKSPLLRRMHFQAEHDAIDRRVARFDVLDSNSFPALGR